MKKIGKIFNIVLGIIVVSLMFFTSCEDTIEREPSPAVSSDCQNVFFTNNNVTDVELEPTDPTQVRVIISRQNSEEAATVPLKVISADSVFIIPDTVTFEAGVDTTSFVVTFPEAEEGIKYSFEIGISGDEYLNPYISDKTSIKISVIRIKWEDIGPGVMIEGIISTLFGVPELYPFYVDIQKATLPGSITRYRLINPFKPMEAEDLDKYGIADGYPYNAPGDMLPGDFYLVIEVDAENNASMEPQQMGFDWGYGYFTVGSIYGNISDNLSAYPLGEYDEDNGVIIFPENSLFVSMANYKDGAQYPCDTPTYIYLSRDDYLAAQSANSEE
ncbi:MAG TPA: hypothetical protein PLE52_01605 [Paludibacteraceae bacterium]|nr:hypothetical protein [Paludibacteraceae bacterium]